MNRIAFRLSLATTAIVASIGVASAQTPDPHHTEAASAAMSMASPSAGMPMPTAGGSTGAPMDGDMARMMEMMRPMMATGMGMPFEHVDRRVTYLKVEMKITEAEAEPWTAFAETMRTNATAMKAMYDSMASAGRPIAMPDRMAAQRKMMSERMAMMDRSEPTTKQLYAALTAEQRTSFNQLMSGPMGMM